MTIILCLLYFPENKQSLINAQEFQPTRRFNEADR